MMKGGNRMNCFVKRILTALLICSFCLVSFVSCSGGIDKDEAKAFISDFFAAIVAEDYEKAETFLHPDRPADLEAFLDNIEQSTNLDFQAGIEIKEYTSSSSSNYDSTVDGSTYKFTIQTEVGENTVEFTIEIVENKNGYGIYNLDIDGKIRSLQ